MGAISDRIRTAILGKDVRNYIADGIEAVESLRFDYDAQVVNAGNSNAEIVDARGGKVNLKARLDGVDSSIYETAKVNQVIPYRNAFVDDFSVLKGYTPVDRNGAAITGAWTIANNILSSPSNIANVNDLFLIKDDFKLADGRVSVVWENPNTALSANASWAGVCFKGKTVNSTLAVVLFNNTKKVVLYKFNGGYTLLSQADIDAAQFVTNKPLMIDIEIVGINCIVKINGKTYINFSNADIISYANGTCGIVASSANVEYSSKQFSNFAISEKVFDIIPSGATKFLFMGDSITNGVKNTTPFPLLFGDIAKSNWKRDLTITNGGVSSDTTAMILTRLITYLSGGTYDVVTIMGGTNDSRIDLSIPITTAIANISEMVKRIKSHGAIPLVFTVPPMSLSVSSQWPTSYNATSYNYIIRLNAVIKQLCYKEKVRCIDVFSAFNDNIATYILSDLLHPNDVGAQLIAQTAYNTIINKY